MQEGGEETMKGQDWGYLEETGEMREREREGNKGWKVEIVLSRLDLQRGSSRDLGLFHQVHKNVPQDAFCCLVT